MAKNQRAHTLPAVKKQAAPIAAGMTKNNVIMTIQKMKSVIL